jgi:hypothetical protein
VTVFDGRAAPAPAPAAFAEIEITTGDLEQRMLTPRALKRIRGYCWGLDASASVVVHLGPMTVPDEELCKTLASLPCPVSFGGAWRAAATAAQRVAELQGRHSAVHPPA